MCVCVCVCVCVFRMVLGLLDQRIFVFCILASFGQVPLQKFEVNYVEVLEAILNLYL